MAEFNHPLLNMEDVQAQGISLPEQVSKELIMIIDHHVFEIKSNFFTAAKLRVIEF